MKSDRLREGFENGEEDAAAGSEEEGGKALLRRKAEGLLVNEQKFYLEVSSRAALCDTCDTLVEESNPPANNYVYRTSLEHNPIMLLLNTLIIQLAVYLNQYASN